MSSAKVVTSLGFAKNEYEYLGSSNVPSPAYLPLPGGIATVGQIPVSTGNGQNSEWQTIYFFNIDGGTTTTGNYPVNSIDGGNA